MDNPKCVRVCVSRKKPGQRFVVRKLVIDFILCHSRVFECSKGLRAAGTVRLTLSATSAQIGSHRVDICL
jgi:hypothetical protein